MKAKIKAMILEKDRMRGLVPARQQGIKDTVYGAYMDRLNPRDNQVVQQALAESKDPRFAEFLERIMMPRYKRISLQTIAKACNIGLAEFSNWWQKQSTHQAIAIVQNAAPQIAADMAQDARSIDAVCERCDGMTWISAPHGLPSETPGYRPITVDGEPRWIRDCPVCTGGRVRKPGDAHARDRVLEMGGLLKKGPGVMITQNFGGMSHASAVSELDEAMSFDVDFESEK